jgi:hypothetical protein
MEPELFEPGEGVSDATILRRLRSIGTSHPAFEALSKLIGNDMKALRALREESVFIRAHPELPAGSKFAAAVRGYLIANKLEWTQQNLETAVASYMADLMVRS